MVDKLKCASLPLAFSRVYDRFGPIASMLRRGGQTRHGQVELDLHRFRSGQVLMLGGLLFEGDG